MGQVAKAKDVDGFTLTNFQMSIDSENVLFPVTPKAVLKILEASKVDLTDSNIVLVGLGELVGKPLSKLLLNMNPATLTVCTKNTNDLSAFTRNADVLISATGSPHLITKGMIKDGAVVIDVGINRVASSPGSSHIVGDVDTNEAFKAASFLAKCPNGVG